MNNTLLMLISKHGDYETAAAVNKFHHEQYEKDKMLDIVRLTERYEYYRDLALYYNNLNIRVFDSDRMVYVDDKKIRLLTMLFKFHTTDRIKRRRNDNILLRDMYADHLDKIDESFAEERAGDLYDVVVRYGLEYALPQSAKDMAETCWDYFPGLYTSECMDKMAKTVYEMVNKEFDEDGNYLHDFSEEFYNKYGIYRADYNRLTAILDGDDF